MEVRVSVSFVGAKKMQKLNEELRRQSYTPAVLSFPYFERISLEKQGSRRRRGSYHEPIDEGLLLGEVLICKSKTKKLAKKNKVTEDEQISALIIRGIRHILGAHHEGDE